MFGLGQLKDTISRYTLDSLPHSLIFLGKEGSGKHSLAEYLAKELDIKLLDVTDIIDDEYILNIYRCPTPYLYLVDLNKFGNGDKKQNILLKLFEEPSSSAFIVLLSKNKSSILPTILNRGTIINIPVYTKEELKQFAKTANIDVDDTYLSTVLLTPGDIKKFYENNINSDAVSTLIDKIIDKLSVASYGNTLTIADKINYKDEYDKIDFDFFFRALLISLYNKYLNEKDEKMLNLYCIVNSTYEKISLDTRLNKQLIVRNLLSKMWKYVH